MRLFFVNPIKYHPQVDAFNWIYWYFLTVVGEK